MEKPSISEPSPLSPTRWTPDAFAWPRSLAALLAILLATGVGIAISGAIAQQIGAVRGASPQLSWGLIAAQLAVYALVVPVLLTAIPWTARRSLADLGLRLPAARAILAGIVGAIGMYAVTIGVANLQFAFTHQKPTETATTLLTGTHDPMLALAFGVLAIAVAPFVEELTFRGFLFNALLRYAPVWLAATISGIIFGLIHGSLTAFLPLAGSGIVLAYVYYKSGSLTASMLTHALFNAINVVLLASGVST